MKFLLALPTLLAALLFFPMTIHGEEGADVTHVYVITGKDSSLNPLYPAFTTCMEPGDARQFLEKHSSFNISGSSRTIQSNLASTADAMPFMGVSSIIVSGECYSDLLEWYDSLYGAQDGFDFSELFTVHRVSSSGQ